MTLRPLCATCALFVFGGFLAAAPVSATSGSLRVLVIKATWGPRPLSDAQAARFVFGDTAGFLRRSSFGRLLLTGDGYGDPLDTMAQGTFDFSPVEKWLLGWLPAPQVISCNGTYTLDQFEIPSRLPQALMVKTGRGQFWLDHREPLGNDLRLRIA